MISVWIFFALLGYLFLAIPAVADKFLLSHGLKDPLSYAFFVGLLGLIILPLVPIFGLPDMSMHAALPALLAGGFFGAALVWHFRGTQRYEASHIIPLTGGLIPLWSLFVGNFITPFERAPTTIELGALALLVVGTVLIDFDFRRGFSWGAFKIANMSALFFALSFLFLKRAFLVQEFWSGLLWRQIGGGVWSLLLLFFFSSLRKEVFGGRPLLEHHASPLRTLTIVLGSQIAGALGTLFVYGAIFAAPDVYVPFIPAFQGVQYVAVLLLTVFISRAFPRVLHEQLSQKDILRKVCAILFMGCGMALLVSQGIV